MSLPAEIMSFAVLRWQYRMIDTYNQEDGVATKSVWSNRNE